MKSLPDITREALEFEQSQWAMGSVFNDTFYTVTADTATAAPGTLLKLDKSADTSMFSLPPATALSLVSYTNPKRSTAPSYPYLALCSGHVRLESLQMDTLLWPGPMAQAESALNVPPLI